MLDLLTWTPAAAFLGIVGIVTVPFLGVLVVLVAVLGVLVAVLAAIVIGSSRFAHNAAGRWRRDVHAVEPTVIRAPVQASRARPLP